MIVHSHEQVAASSGVILHLRDVNTDGRARFLRHSIIGATTPSGMQLWTVSLEMSGLVAVETIFANSSWHSLTRVNCCRLHGDGKRLMELLWL